MPSGPLGWWEMAEMNMGDWFAWHAGFADREGATVPSIYEATKAEDGEALDAALGDLVAAFVVLNRDLNGETPSETVGLGSDPPRRVAWAVLAISQLLRDGIGGELATARAVWVVEAAWGAVLDGDIDDIEEHLKLEEEARSG
jgi:hypothetical protein